jgi:hypothetical protein
MSGETERMMVWISDLPTDALAYRDLHKGCDAEIAFGRLAVPGTVVLAYCLTDAEGGKPAPFLGVYRENGADRWLENDGPEPWGRTRLEGLRIVEVVGVVGSTAHPVREGKPVKPECTAAYPCAWPPYHPCPPDYDRAREVELVAEFLRLRAESHRLADEAFNAGAYTLSEGDRGTVLFTDPGIKEAYARSSGALEAVYDFQEAAGLRRAWRHEGREDRHGR